MLEYALPTLAECKDSWALSYLARTSQLATPLPAHENAVGIIQT